MPWLNSDGAICPLQTNGAGDRNTGPERMVAVPTTAPIIPHHRQALAARRARLRRVGRDAPRPLDERRWVKLHRQWGPYPNPTVLWGMGQDGFPVILELNNPSAGPLFVLTEGTQIGNSQTLFTALILSLGFLNDPDTVTFHLVTDRLHDWQWVRRVPNFDGLSHPGETGLTVACQRAEAADRYLVVFADGDEAMRSLMKADLLRTGPRYGFWPLVFCSSHAFRHMAHTTSLRNGTLVWELPNGTAWRTIIHRYTRPTRVTFTIPTHE